MTLRPETHRRLESASSLARPRARPDEAGKFGPIMTGGGPAASRSGRPSPARGAAGFTGALTPGRPAAR